ncbi:MAG TPA: sn-glycerol-3-phosphate ABC transporter ATP-binding protein UgpC [Acholeplasmataceae bacterium]|jgi:multiple sugar transport system ATP-binding protein|nr:sn-glycerol-3-phosphate ABC transporter ATP-binding protein UgpC [Acholeplasmataceae bacterium]
MPKVELIGLKKIYDNNVQAVYDFNLEIEEGEFVVLVGPSGCGKTTTLRMVAGLEDITDGRLIIDGNDITAIPPKDRDIAFVFQDYALYAHMTVYQNMAFSLVLRKENSNLIHKKVLAAAEILGLTEQLNKKPKQLSGGQRQRVAIGRAIVRNPKLFLFDEPLSNLDAKLRNAMRRELLLLHKKLNATIIYVTHDQMEALTLADKIVCMSMGYVQQIGTPLELYYKPNNLFVANFIGLPPMNLLDVEVKRNAISSPLFEIPLDLHHQKSLKDYVGKKVVMGIRAEHIYEQGDIPLKVWVNENLGQSTLIHGYLKNQKIICKFKRWANYQVDDIIKIGFDFENIHFFDKETTMAIR